jgi:hypothetical protein
MTLWNQVLPMNEKIHFISDYLNGVFLFTELCRHDTMRGKAGYK